MGLLTSDQEAVLTRKLVEIVERYNKEGLGTESPMRSRAWIRTKKAGC